MQLFDVEEMACEILNIDYDVWCNSNSPEDLDEKLSDKYDGISLNTFGDLLQSLAKFTIITKSPISGEYFQGFIKIEENRYIFKVNI